MKRYLLFAGDTYYPLGGAEDLVGSYETFAQAMNALPHDGPDWAHIYDTKRGSLIAEWDKHGGWTYMNSQIP